MESLESSIKAQLNTLEDAQIECELLRIDLHLHSKPQLLESFDVLKSIQQRLIASREQLINVFFNVPLKLKKELGLNFFTIMPSLQRLIHAQHSYMLENGWITALHLTCVENLKCLLRLQKLHTLCIQEFPSKQISVLQSLSSLRELHLTGTEFDPCVLRELKNITALTCRLCQYSLFQFLRDHPSLEHLTLDMCGNFSGVKHLSTLPNLKSITYKSCSPSQNDQILLKKSLPNCNIQYI